MARVQTRRTISFAAEMFRAVGQGAAAAGISVSQYAHEAIERRLEADGLAAPVHRPAPRPGPRAIPDGRKLGRPPLDEAKRLEIVRVATEWRGSLSTKEIVEIVGGVGITTARVVLRAAGVPRPGSGCRNGLKRIDRRDAARAMRAEGKTLAQIGEALGVTRERARQLAKKVYVDERTDGGGAR